MLSLKPRQPVEEEAIECWDDDDLDIGGSDLTFNSRAASIATTASGFPNHRESISSRLSFRSDMESMHGDEERQVHVPADDEKSKNDAIAAATRAGIPLPQNVPASALMGGTIKRLGGRKVKKIIQDDWDDDLELPSPGEGGLQIKRQDPSSFPDALRQVSGPSSITTSPTHREDDPFEEDLRAKLQSQFGMSPSSTTGSAKNMQEIDHFATIRPKAASSFNLDKFRDDDDDDDDLFGANTIKVSKRRQIKPVTVILPPTPQKGGSKEDGDFGADFELPDDSEPLRLSIGRDIPRTPANLHDDLEEWGEGSLGTRFGGTRRSDISNRSSSVSALSPSIASSITAESDDDGLDGLVLPTGPVNFEDILKKRKTQEHVANNDLESPSKPMKAPAQTRPQPAPRQSSKEDFLFGLEIGDGDVFGSNRSTLNKNVKVKTTRQLSPQRPKTTVALKFTDKPSPPVTSRLPRPLAHERHPSLLEPVSESGQPIPLRSKRGPSRLSGHTPHSSLSSIPTPSTPTSTGSMLPSTPRRRELGNKTSITGLRNEPTTTNSQLLRMKRSMPTMKSTQSPAKPMIGRYERPPSRTDQLSRASASGRPKTPVERDRSGAESSMSNVRRNPVPFLPAGASSSQSHHITIKTFRHFRQNDSVSSNLSGSSDFRSQSRAMSRATMRSPSPNRTKTRSTEQLAREAVAKRQLTRPTRQRHFGVGNELDAFDDLPTSQAVEQKFVKQPVGRGPPKALLRNKAYHSMNNLSERTTTPVPGPYSPARYEARQERQERQENNLPRFARDTNASRMARETVLSQRAPSHGGPLSTLTNQWRAQISAKTGLQPVSTPSVRTKKKPVQKKPHLIKPLSDLSKTTKQVKGMVYNPVTFRWEGNENDLSPFDAPSDTPTQAAMPPHIFREKENSTPRPALITNISATQGVQVVGGMVFDPQRMCWLKVPQKRDMSRSRQSEGGDTMDGFDALDDEEDDPFKDVPDLEDKPKTSSSLSPEKGGGRMSMGSTSGLKDDWLVGEEFDVGPEFIRRQREEEERWRRKVEKWVGKERDAIDDYGWRWLVRDIVNQAQG